MNHIFLKCWVTMPVQMYLNQGPQDQLLYCADRSYFTNTGYTCTTNFQTEFRDVDPVSTAKLGGTARFIIPKAADLLGHVDLLATVNPATGGGVLTSAAAGKTSSMAYWVNKLGFAMIEKVTMTIGSNLIEEITGEQLDIINELMREGKDKLGWHTIMRDAKSASYHVLNDTISTDFDKGKEGISASGWHATGGELDGRDHYTRYITNTDLDNDGGTPGNGSNTGKTPSYTQKGSKLIVPLGLFFSKHPSQYFPLGAIAGCNDIVIEIKFRALNSLIGINLSADTGASSALTAPTWAGEPVDDIKLRCTYVHLTGPEAALHMNKEHVRLMRQWKNLNFTKSLSTGSTTWPVDLSFLHPVSFLVITLRKTNQIDNTTASASAGQPADGVSEKGYFNYYGDGRNPLLDWKSGAETTTAKDNVNIKNISLTLNGQERHPGISGNKLDHHYLKHRVMPQLFSSGDFSAEALAHSTVSVNNDQILRHEVESHRHELLGAKAIYVYPFCLNPEGANPSGSVNFSKVSHAKLTVELDVAVNAATEFRMDVYAVGYNWLQLKDGRGLLSFA